MSQRSGCPVTPYVLYSLILCPILEVFLAHRRNYHPLVERTCLLICLHFIFLTPWLLFYHTTISVFSCFSFFFCLILLAITFLFGLIVLHQFIVLVLKSSNNSGDVMSMYNLCTKFSVLTIGLVTVVSVAAIKEIAHFLSA